MRVLLCKTREARVSVRHTHWTSKNTALVLRSKTSEAAVRLRLMLLTSSY